MAKKYDFSDWNKPLRKEDSKLFNIGVARRGKKAQEEDDEELYSSDERLIISEDGDDDPMEGIEQEEVFAPAKPTTSRSNRSRIPIPQANKANKASKKVEPIYERTTDSEENEQEPELKATTSKVRLRKRKAANKVTQAKKKPAPKDSDSEQNENMVPIEDLNGKDHEEQAMVYKENQKILCKYGNLYYKAKIMEIDMDDNGKLLMLVHYEGWNKRYDDVIREEEAADYFLEPTAENIAYWEQALKQATDKKKVKK